MPILYKEKQKQLMKKFRIYKIIIVMKYIIFIGENNYIFLYTLIPLSDYYVYSYI